LDKPPFSLYDGARERVNMTSIIKTINNYFLEKYPQLTEEVSEEFIDYFTNVFFFKMNICALIKITEVL